MIPHSELILRADGSVFHLHLQPAQLADKVVLVGDPARVSFIGTYLTNIECDVVNREYHSITGQYQGKRLTVVSHGIGCGNIDIVVNELDALANVDFQTRTVKKQTKALTLVRIGTAGGLQKNMTVGTYVAAQTSIGLDGVIYFYANNEQIRNLAFENELVKQLHWNVQGVRPYVVEADQALVEQITQNDIAKGVTLTANGFYAPQGRMIRLPLHDPKLNEKITKFQFAGRKINNYEMESSALAALAKLMGHRAMTVCCIIAGRIDKKVNANYNHNLPHLIETVLQRI